MRYTSHQQPHVRMVSDEQIQELHLATLEILERTGVEVKQKRAVELLEKAGARVEGERVCIPADLVENAIRSAPERVVVCSRTGERVMPLEANRVFFGTGSDTPNTIDPETRERRRARRKDVERIARLCDALPNMDFIMSMGVAGDVPEQAPFVYEFADMVAGSSKPIVFTASDERDMADIYEMAVAVCGGEIELRRNPFLLHYAEPITPLIHSPTGLRKLLFCADHRLPVAYVSGMSAGTGSPATLAGALAIVNAECLSGLVIHQLAAPGAPFIYGANVSVVDWRTLTMVYGGPELPLTNAALAQMARRYRLPCWGMAGTSDAKTVDAQAGLEAMQSILMAVLSRGNLVHDVGYIESGLTSSMEMIAVCDEMIAMARMLFRGIPVDDEHLALDLVEEVGIGGQFYATEHTAKFFRTDHFLPRLLDRDNYDGWKTKGCRSLEDKANACVLEILASHRPAPVPDGAQEVIASVLARWAARC
ncbi:MAG TPA: trimethylamine methyltransferase family protein [Armatimonadota bacterium]|nr:trimethylamine methyltransferase family protein [Armatimonadota bacterium]